MPLLVPTFLVFEFWVSHQTILARKFNPYFPIGQFNLPFCSEWYMESFFSASCAWARIEAKDSA
jgi:hypothetical protein